MHGAQGAVGTNGAQGAVGSGAQGAVGTAGAQGDQGLAGAAGAQGDQGLAGTAGAQGDQGLAGIAGAQGDQGLAGAAGAQGDQGLAGTAGAQGDQGLVGAQGTDGNFGGATFDYHTHLPAGVGAPDNPGGVLFNNSNQNSSTKINIDDADDDGNSISTFMTTIINVSNPILGFVRISNKLDSSQFLLFHITAIQTVSSGSNTYYELTVTNQGSSAISPFSDSEDVIISFVTNGNQGASGAQGAIGTAGAQGATGIEGAQGAVGPQGITGTPGSASAAFRASLNITTAAEDIDDGNQPVSGEIYIVPPNSSSNPTNYQTITYHTINYSNPVGTFSNSSGEITVTQSMRASITYVTTVRSKNNDDYSCFIKLEKYSGGSWTEIPNTNVSAVVKRAQSLKQSCTGHVIVDLAANNKIRARICIVRVTGVSSNDALYVTKDTNISIVDLFGGTAGAQGAIGSAGAQGDEGLAGAQGAVGFNGAQGAGGPSGAQGATGVGGAQGAVGPGGAQGSPGGPGTQGPAGEVGAQGDQGLAGAQGAAGAAGAQGDIGAAGAQGNNGAQGAAGAQGLAGAQGAAGAQGVPGLGGPQGGNGAQGVVGQGWKAQGVFKFMMDLQGEKTQWGPNGEPPSLVNSNVSGLTNLTGFEFFKIAPAFYLDVKFPAFPLQNGSQGIITPTIPSRICQNTMYGYLMPANGEILGFSVDFVRLGRGAQFRVFGWNPASNTVTFTMEVKSVNADYEEYGSGTTNLEEKLPIKAGQYLFAIQPIAGIDNPALGPAHITAYVRFTD